MTRQEIFALASRKLRADFQELKLIPHHGVKGGEAETSYKALPQTTPTETL
jgi:hypothetical protein